MDKIICLGKNYLDHASELGDKVPEMPVLFLKPPSTAVFAKNAGETLEVALPFERGDIHFECELVLQLSASGSLMAFTLGLDMTLRNLQAKLKKEGHPWEISKVFAGSAIVGPWLPIERFPDYLNSNFSFLLNGVVKQSDCGRSMRLSPQECVDYAKSHFPICEGDLLFTGTPAGVGAVRIGQCAELKFDNNLLYLVNFVSTP